MSATSPAGFTCLASAPTEVQGMKCGSNSSNTVTCTLSSNTTLTNFLAIGVVVNWGSGDNYTLTSVVHGTSPSETCVIGSSYQTSEITGNMNIAYCANMANNSKTVVITESNSSSAIVGYVKELHGPTAIDQTPVGAEGSSASILSTLSGTTACANEVLFAVTDTGNSASATGSWAIPSDCPSGTSCALAQWAYSTMFQQIVASTGTYQLTASQTSSGWDALMATFK